MLQGGPEKVSDRLHWEPGLRSNGLGISPDIPELNIRYCVLVNAGGIDRLALITFTTNSILFFVGATK